MSEQSHEKRTYLLAWNAKKTPWEDQKQINETLARGQSATVEWSCGTVKRIPVGSRVFLIRLGADPRGLVASGSTTSEVFEKAHWDQARARAGKMARYVRIRLDVLSLTPLIHRFELDDERFRGFRWDIQMSGVRIPDDVASVLEDEWQTRVAARTDGASQPVVPVEVLRRWKGFWETVATDTEWVERHRVRDGKREEILPDIRTLVEGFLAGGVDLEAFRDTFDTKTRNEWDLFGLKGMSGAMFLNKLVKHIPDRQRLKAQLQRALLCPKDLAEARGKVDELTDYLDELIESGAVTRGDVQPNRAPFFLSACWHALQPTRWPIVYQSARKAFQTDGLLGRKGKGPDDYTEFVRLYRELRLLKYKKNLVLQGPPGTGKTFLAKRLAYLLLGEKDEERVEQVQFHQSYSYEDFVQGYRPNTDGGFERHDGPFLRFCDKALQDVKSNYVLIVDEINRGNLSKILGELMLLLEPDKRSESWSTTLTYSQEGESPFWVPPNVHVIGTMNTADRSLALVDYALRRRFVFVDVEPAFESEGFAKRLQAIGVGELLRSRITTRFRHLNEEIAKDPNLGAGYMVGHSYFCAIGDGEDHDRWYERVVATEVAPLLREYWPDERDRVDQALLRLTAIDG